MAELFLFDGILVIIIAFALFLVKKYIKEERKIRILLLISPLLTVLCHYSSILYHYLKDTSQIEYLTSNPNLLLPIYPCNVVMWCALIYGIICKKESKITDFLADYVFFFGIFSALIGMLVNVDFVNNPTLKNYDVTKGILAHALMLFNVLLLPTVGKIKISLPKNYIHILISMIGMYVIGVYCNTVFSVLASKETAWAVNSMFILHSPFDGFAHLRYPLICLLAAVLYFIMFAIIELFAYKKGNRWISRLKSGE